MDTQLTRGLKRRLMYAENKDRTIAGAHARIGWVTFSKSTQSVYYRGRELAKVGGRGHRWELRRSRDGRRVLGEPTLTLPSVEYPSSSTTTPRPNTKQSAHRRVAHKPSILKQRFLVEGFEK
jgi:hypothetical protein